jgi:4'-phosphopantetheinyl transferase
VLKATGDGLAAPMSGVTVSGPGEPPALLGYAGRPGLVVAMAELTSRPGHAAALAVLGLRTPPKVAERDATALLAAPEYPPAPRGSTYS